MKKVFILATVFLFLGASVFPNISGNIEFNIKINDNNPPEPPVITGPSNGKPGIYYTFTFNSTDPDGNEIKYVIYWGDTTTYTPEMHPSGVAVQVSHFWNKEGVFLITAKAVDNYGAESDWSEPFTFNTSRYKTINTLLLGLIDKESLLKPNNAENRISVVAFGILIKTVFGKSNLFKINNLIQDDDVIGTIGVYKSRSSIPSPDGNNYSCIMYCNDHTQTLEWISLVNQLGFEKAWQKQFIKLIMLFLLPGSIILFGLDDFRLWYLSLFIKHKYKSDFLNCLNNYNELNGTGIIMYQWTSGFADEGYDFKSQPDNSWINNSWIFNDNDVFVPNPEIWNKYALLPIG